MLRQAILSYDIVWAVSAILFWFSHLSDVSFSQIPHSTSLLLIGRWSCTIPASSLLISTLGSHLTEERIYRSEWRSEGAPTIYVLAFQVDLVNCI